MFKGDFHVMLVMFAFLFFQLSILLLKRVCLRPQVFMTGKVLWQVMTAISMLLLYWCTKFCTTCYGKYLMYCSALPIPTGGVGCCPSAGRYIVKIVAWLCFTIILGRKSITSLACNHRYSWFHAEISPYVFFTFHSGVPMSDQASAEIAIVKKWPRSSSRAGTAPPGVRRWWFSTFQCVSDGNIRFW